MESKFIRTTTVTGRSYDYFKTIKILNVSQAAFYMSKGVELKDVKQSEDKNGKPILVFYFYRDDTKEAYDLWCKARQVNNNDLP